MQNLKVLIPVFLLAFAACGGEDVSLGNKGDAGFCTVQAGTALDMPCGNIMCNGETQYCSVNTWPDPCKPLPCECAALPPSSQSCACLMKYITPMCGDAGATCTNNQAGLIICN